MFVCRYDGGGGGDFSGGEEPIDDFDDAAVGYIFINTISLPSPTWGGGGHLKNKLVNFKQ